MKIALYNFKVLKIKREVENMKKINVLQVCSYLDLGGIQKRLQIITKYLDKNIFNVSVCVLGPGGVRERAIKEMGIKVYNVNKNPEKFAKLIEDKNFYGKVQKKAFRKLEKYSYKNAEKRLKRLLEKLKITHSNCLN